MKLKEDSYYSEVAPNVWRVRDLFVNLYFVCNPVDHQWVIIDTGLRSAAPKIKHAVAQLFGTNSCPSAVLLTHGHFDHVGSLKELIDEWKTPVYAHPLEFPYLTGQSDYPPPDPTVGNGLMAEMAWVYPKSPINIKNNLRALPKDGSVPFLEEWRYIHTPGHAPGHVSFFRDKDKVLIAGDAFVTTKQESALSVMLQKAEISGPPKYFTYDWQAAKESVKQLAKLNPQVIATGHGPFLSDERARRSLQDLANHFDDRAVPKQGRYIDQPAVVNESGVESLPPRKQSLWLALTMLVIILVLISWLFFID